MVKPRGWAMNHQPFEDWLLGEAELSPDEAAACLEHVAQCSQCRDLQHAWVALEAELAARTQVEPDAGFTMRWNTRLQAERLAQGRRRAVLLFAASFLALLLLGLTRVPETVTLPEIATRLLGSAVKLGNLFYLVRNILSTFISATSDGWAVTWWAAVSAAACALVGTWFVSIYYFTLRGVRKGVTS